MSSRWVAGALIAGRYRLERLLGQGGMGVVWAATHTVTRRSVALKFLTADARSAPARRRFLREARAAAVVRHPSIIDIYDVLELEDGSPVMVMELLSGESLADRLRRERRLPLRQAASILLQVAAAVGSAHAVGVIHRDLKPENIFLDDGAGERVSERERERERVKVLDFGIAKLTAAQGDAAQSTDLTGSGALLGTPCYMAPEQVFGERQIDHRADIWALGLILYECLSGVLPTRAENLGQVFKIIATETIPPLTERLPDVPRELSTLVARMLSRDPERRPADLRQVADVLARHAGAAPPSFGPPSAPSSSPPEPAAPSRTWQVIVHGDRDARPLAETESLQGTRVEAEPPFLVPFLKNPGFVGRKEDLAHLHALLQKGEAVGVRPAALTGMGGIGKTQLAVEYAYHYRDAYPGGLYWVNAAQSWSAELARLAEEVGLREDNAPEIDRQRRLALAFARFLKARPDALLLFDNVDDPRALQSDALGFVPTALGCRLLFTTRRRDLRSPFTSVEVRVLPPSAALELLLSTDARRDVLAQGSEAERAEGAAICQALGCLPLALVLAAAYLDQNPEIALSDYRGRLAREGVLATLDDNELDASDLATRHDAAVGATLRLSWDALKSDEARRVIQAAALLGEAAQVPRARLSLLTGLRDRAEGGHPARLGSALRRLRDLSLVEELTEQEIRLHPLVREFAEQKIEGRAAFAEACAERLFAALREMGRLHEEVAARGIDEVLGDLRVGALLSGPSGQARFERLIRPLDREAHCLRGWAPTRQPGLLLQQLRNRCFEMELDDVQHACEGELEERRWPHLRERSRTSRESAALVRTLEGHTSGVTGVAVTADGRYAVSASSDRTLKVWDLASGQTIRTLEGHHDRVLGVAVTADGRHAVSASYDRTVKVWDLASGQTIRTLEGHRDKVIGVAVTVDDRHAISASADTTLRVWDLSTGRTIRTLEGHTGWVNGVAVTPDGRHAVSASEDRTLRVWDLSTGQAVYILAGHMGWVNGVAVTPDGRHAVSASADRTLKVWDLKTGKEIRTLEGHTGRVMRMAVTADGRHAVSASHAHDHTFKVWDLSTGQAIRTLEGHSDKVNGAAVTADGRHAVSASEDRTLKVWDLQSGQAAGSLTGHTMAVNSVAVTADGLHAVSASEDRTVKLWELNAGKEVHAFLRHAGLVKGVAVTADGRRAVSASSDRTLKVWDLKAGNEILTLSGHTDWVNGVTITPDGRRVISASADRTLKVWDLQAGREIRTLSGHTGPVIGVAIMGDGRHAISASADRTLKVWDLSTGHALSTLAGHTGPVRSVAVTVDGRHVISASEDRTLKRWDLKAGKEISTLAGHTGPVRGVAVTTDGLHAVSVSEDRTLKVWDLSTGQASVTLETHAPLCCCALALDGKTMVAGDSVGAVHMLAWVAG